MADLEKEEYIKLKETKKNIIFAHCANCIKDMGIESSPEKWSHLEAIIDLKTGILTLGCARCNLPIICAMLPNDLVKHLDDCGCEICKSDKIRRN